MNFNRYGLEVNCNVMGRTKKYASNAERQRSYRQRHRIGGDQSAKYLHKLYVNTEIEAYIDAIDASLDFFFEVYDVHIDTPGVEPEPNFARLFDGCLAVAEWADDFDDQMATLTTDCLRQAHKRFGSPAKVEDFVTLFLQSIQ
jgi:hypothetical protein